MKQVKQEKNGPIAKNDKIEQLAEIVVEQAKQEQKPPDDPWADLTPVDYQQQALEDQVDNDELIVIDSDNDAFEKEIESDYDDALEQFENDKPAIIKTVRKKIDNNAQEIKNYVENRIKKTRETEYLLWNEQQKQLFDNLPENPTVEQLVGI